MDPKLLSASGRKHLHLIELDKKEKIVYEIRKHPIGLIGIYLLGIIVTLAIFAASLGLARFLHLDDTALGDNASTLGPVIILLGGILSVLSLIMTAIGAYLYQSNVVYVTDEKIAQVTYKTIFHRKISQLSIGDVQDVTTNQNGLFPRLFNYGTLIVETSGEQVNYVFTFTPRPYEASRAIVNAHEENLKLYGN